MATSRLKTTLSVTRHTLGIKYGQLDYFCNLTGLNKSLVEKVCAGIKPLSQDAAMKVSMSVGVNYLWLLKATGQKLLKPLTPENKPFTKEFFLEWRQAREAQTEANQTARYFIANSIAKILAALNNDPQSSDLLAFHLDGLITKYIPDIAMEYRNTDCKWLFDFMGAKTFGTRSISWIGSETSREPQPKPKKKPTPKKPRTA